MKAVLLRLHLDIILDLIRLLLLPGLHLVSSLQIALSTVLPAPLLVNRPLADQIDP